jgi:hypothetical protein
MWTSFWGVCKSCAARNIAESDQLQEKSMRLMMDCDEVTFGSLARIGEKTKVMGCKRLGDGQHIRGNGSPLIQSTTRRPPTLVSI